MDNTSSNKKHGLFVLGSLYPEVTGGMEIFNYYFLLYRLAELHKKDLYLTTQPLKGFGQLHLKGKRRWPVRFFYPLQLFFVLLKHRSRIAYAYMGYARQTWEIPFFYGLIFRFFHIPYIVTIHSGGKPQWKYKYPYRYYFRNAHTLVGVSESVCADYGSLTERDLKYIAPLIPFHASKMSKSLAKEQLGFAADDRVLLYLGSIKKMKNPDKVLAAVEYLGNKTLPGNKLKLVFVGGGEMLEGLKRQAEASDWLKKTVFFAGMVGRDKVPDYFAMADCYVISSDYEGTSVSLLEAMYNRLPIIGADAPGINSMLQDNRNALLYRTDDIKGLATCIQTLMTDELLAEKLAEQAKQDFEAKYSYERMIAEYEQLFVEVSADNRNSNTR